MGRDGMGPKIDEMRWDGTGLEIDGTNLGRNANLVGRFGTGIQNPVWDKSRIGTPDPSLNLMGNELI